MSKNSVKELKKQESFKEVEAMVKGDLDNITEEIKGVKDSLKNLKNYCRSH